MSIKHAFTSGIPDGNDATQVQPSHWNDEHVVDIFVDAETPSGAIDSTTGYNGNPVFNLAQTPNPSSSLKLYRNGILQTAGTHFNLLVATITYTFGNLPIVGDNHMAYYRKV